MRQSMESHHGHAQSTGPLIQNVEPPATGFTTSFGHPLDMLARTAANTHSPDLDRFNAGNGYNKITPPVQPPPRPSSIRVGPSDSIPTTWNSDLSAIDPVERGWIDVEDAKFLFER